MRIFQSVGAADPIAATSRCSERYDFLTADGQILLRFEGADQIGPGGWPGANMIHQPSLERALRDELASQPRLELRSRWAFTGYEEQGDHIVASFETPDGPQVLTASYLVGADGTRSPVRTAAGIGMVDLEFDEPWLVIDAIVHDYERLPKVNLQICDPARPTTCVLMGEGRHRWEFMIRPEETPEQVLGDDFIEKLLEPWSVKGAVTLERKAVYRSNARIAKDWRKGRVLLAGDAAHQTPPFAGQGLCAGARDAANLGWKLGMIAAGQASESLLDAYQGEREPHVRAMIGMAMMMGKTVCITDPVAASIRDEQMLAARAAGQSPDGRIEAPGLQTGIKLGGSPATGSYFPQLPGLSGHSRLDDLLGPGAWLIARSAVPAPDGVISASLEDDRLSGFAAALKDWLTGHQAEAVLVRPDRYVFGTGTPAELLAAWSGQTTAGA